MFRIHSLASIACLLAASTVGAQSVPMQSYVSPKPQSVPVSYAASVTYPTPIHPSSGYTVCPECGRIHGPGHSSGVQHVGYNSNPVSTTNYSSGLQSESLSRISSPTSLRSSGGVSNVFSTLNAQRTGGGSFALQFDPHLQAVAERRAQQMAAQGLKNHVGGSFAPGRFEGVGWSSSYAPSGVSACFINDSRMIAAGAAMAAGRDGVYFSVVYR